MAELMLVNPRRRKRKKSSGRRGKRRMTALQRQYFGGGRKAGPKRRRRSRRRVAALASSPSPARRSRRRRVGGGRKRSRRMSFGGGGGGKFSINRFLQQNLIPGGIGALGAVGVDIALGYARPYLPAMLQGGVMDPVVKIAGAIAVGYAAGQVMGRRFGEQAMAGAITVALYDIVKSTISSAVPGLLSEYDSIGYYSAAQQVGEYVGEYVGVDGVGDYQNGGDFYPV